MAIITYQCPNCGAEIKFNPTEGKGKCDFCLSTFDIGELEEVSKEKYKEHLSEENIKETKYNDQWDKVDENIELYKCPRCGAEVVTEKTTSATFCAYCHSAVILSENIKGEFKPSKVIPFKYTREQAIDEFKKWCGKKKFLPGEFTSHKQLEKISGIYVPFWLADCNVEGQLRATGKKIKVWRQGDYEYTKTDIYSVYRKANMKFENIPSNASKKMEDTIMESIEPYNYSQMDDFKIAYLPGFLSEKYDKNKKDVLPRVEERVKESTKIILRNSIKGYDMVTEQGSNCRFKESQFQYALLPVWLMTYNYKNKTYIYAMNGQTGKVFGYLPVSKEKLWALFSIIAIVLTLLLSIGGIMII